MEEYGNDGIFGVDRKQIWAVDGKQEIYLECPNYSYVASYVYWPTMAVT